MIQKPGSLLNPASCFHLSTTALKQTSTTRLSWLFLFCFYIPSFPPKYTMPISNSKALNSALSSGITLSLCVSVSPHRPYLWSLLVRTGLPLDLAHITFTMPVNYSELLWVCLYFSLDCETPEGIDHEILISDKQHLYRVHIYRCHQLLMNLFN